MNLLSHECEINRPIWLCKTCTLTTWVSGLKNVSKNVGSTWNQPKIREKLFYWQKLGILGFFGLLPHLRFHHRSMPSFLLWIASPPSGEAWSLEQRDDAWMGWDGMAGRIPSKFPYWLLVGIPGTDITILYGNRFFTPGLGPYSWTGFDRQIAQRLNWQGWILHSPTAFDRDAVFRQSLTGLEVEADRALDCFWQILFRGRSWRIWLAQSDYL